MFLFLSGVLKANAVSNARRLVDELSSIRCCFHLYDYVYKLYLFPLFVYLSHTLSKTSEHKSSFNPASCAGNSATVVFAVVLCASRRLINKSLSHHQVCTWLRIRTPALTLKLSGQTAPLCVALSFMVTEETITLHM